MRVLATAIAAILSQTASSAPVEFGRSIQPDDIIEQPTRRRAQIRHRSHENEHHQAVVKGSEERYDAYLGLSTEEEATARRNNNRKLEESMSMSMSVPSDEMCSFCIDGFGPVGPDYVLPTNDGASCATAQGYAMTLPKSDTMCATVQLAQGICCPGAPVQPTVEPPAPGSIYEIASNADDFSTLAAAAAAAGLADTLSGDGTFTVFAPTNDAFAKVPAEIVAKLMDPVWVPQLQDVLLYHTLGSVVLSTDLTDGLTATTLNEEDITINLDPARVNNASNIIAADIIADNGVIHGIDAVLAPTSLTSNIVDLAVATDELSTLVAAVTAAGLGDALSGDGPFTVFAPTNEAFAELPEGTVDNLLLPENIEQLTDILKYHVVAANAPSSGLSDGSVETLNGDSVNVTVSDGGVMVNDATVTSADIIASNGIVHIIDKVLLPPTDETPATEPPVPTPVNPIEPTLCSCSPLQYDFELNLGQDCDVDDLEGKGGVGLTFCFLGSFDGQRRLSNSFSKNNMRTRHTLQKSGRISFDKTGEYTPEQVRQLQSQELEVISLQFLEFDTSGELIVINQDDSYADTSLSSGDVVSFKSIANDLEPSVPIEDQLDFLPGGVQVTIRGRIVDAVTGEETIVSNRITWSYTNACDAEPVDVGDSIGWVTTDELMPASKNFCPASSETTTTTTVTTEAPPATTTTTTTNTPDMSMSMMPTVPPMFGKSGKAGSKSSKNSKQLKSTLTPKANKTPKNPMAKVHKEDSKDDGHQDDPVMNPKAGKAIEASAEQLDAKAVKKSGSLKMKESSNGKSGKLAKTSSKAVKEPSAKSGKSHEKMSVSSKAGRLFPKAHKVHDNMSI